MKNAKYLLITLLLVLFNIPLVYAECTNEEINKIKKETEKIEITYKHLGEVTKEDGSKVYNEFEVTTSNIPENIYIHLSPMTEEKFIEENKILKIKLTTGEWTYELYSSTCETTIDEIKVKLPTFNQYSLDPLCDGVDGKDFKLCSKYYEYTVDRDTFERRVKEYRDKHLTKEEQKENKKNYMKRIVNYIKDKYIYFIAIGVICIVIFIMKMITTMRNKRKTL